MQAYARQVASLKRVDLLAVNIEYLRLSVISNIYMSVPSNPS